MTAPRSTRQSYSQWIRRIVAGRGGQGMIPLFDSSVPEPQELLCGLVSSALAAPIDERYASAFSAGNPFVVRHLCDRYGVSPDHILCTTGATRAIALLYQALARVRGHILVETPGFDLFAELARFQGIPHDTFERPGPDFAIDRAAIEAALRPDTRIVVLSNLHNPSGALTSAATLAELARLAEDRDLTILVDEVYADYVAPHARAIHAAAISPRLVTIGSLTKIYGLSTLRCGWIVADPAILALVREVSDRTEFGVSNLAHAAAAVVMDNAGAFDAYARDIVDRARPVIAGRFEEWRSAGLISGFLPDHGCIAFPRLVGIDRTEIFAEWLAERTGVIVAPGEYFGAPGHVRLGFARCPRELERGLDAFAGGLRAFARQDGRQPAET